MTSRAKKKKKNKKRKGKASNDIWPRDIYDPVHPRSIEIEARFIPPINGLKSLQIKYICFPFPDFNYTFILRKENRDKKKEKKNSEEFRD